MHHLTAPWMLDQVAHLHDDADHLREALFTTALQEMAACRTHLRSGYDPLIDPRFRWAVQYLEKLEGYRRSIDPDIEATASLYLHPIPFLSRQDLAAHDDSKLI